jgi:hypothetical protein
MICPVDEERWGGEGEVVRVAADATSVRSEAVVWCEQSEKDKQSSSGEKRARASRGEEKKER